MAGYLGNDSGQGARRANRHSRTTAFRGNGSNAAVQMRMTEPKSASVRHDLRGGCGAPWV
jgi:hypothetical protein